jgi:hypothetical protein
VLVALVVLSLVLWFARKATKNMTLVPHKAQNFFEFIVEFLYGQVEGIVGPKQAKLAFPLLGRSSSTSWSPTGSACCPVLAPSAGASPRVFSRSRKCMILCCARRRLT